MTGAFYLTATETVGGMWYMLMVRKTHFCLSCGGDLETRLRTLKSCVKEHRTEQRLLDALDRLDCGGKVSPATFDQREDYYREHGEDYGDLIESTVLEALAEAREEDKKNNPLRKTTSRLKKAGGLKTINKSQEVSPKESSSPAKDLHKDSTTSTTAVVRKPRLLKRR